jgi:molybdate transport system substrate-binding protein
MLRLLAVLCSLASPAAAETALAAVAANFAGTAEQLILAFNAKSGHRVTLTTGSTGKLYAQIVRGAPFDLFLSADVETPARLSGMGPIFPYAIGKLVLWAPQAGAKADPSDVLRAARYIAIANPDLAPYGKAALSTLAALGFDAKAETRLVMGQNIGQTYGLVASGAAEVGFIAASTQPKGGLIWEVPETLHPSLQQDAILLSEANPAAAGFAAYLHSDEARAIVKTYGYGVPK